jgi:hypothetical protein
MFPAGVFRRPLSGGAGRISEKTALEETWGMLAFLEGPPGLLAFPEGS